MAITPKTLFSDMDDIRVSLTAILVDGVERSWTLAIHRDEYVYRCLYVEVHDDDTTGSAYAPYEDGTYPEHGDIPDLEPLSDSDEVAWS